MPDLTTVRWGILGAGSIAKRFTEGAQSLPDAQVIAVGSRTQEKADAFADEFNIPHRHVSYEALVADPDVDVIYVATPHPMHKENTLLALNAGKPVLCEKPFTINAREAEEAVRTAREKRLFLMEGMWTRFFPAMYEVRRLIKEGAIGEVRMLQADFGFRGAVNPESRLFNPALGGGALLDVGVYVVSLSSMVLGAPDRVTGLATMVETGVDEAAGIVLGYPQGQIAVLSTAVRVNTPWEAAILGTEGRILIHNAWWKPERFTLVRSGQPNETIESKSESTGFNYEAAEVGRCLRQGKLESDVMPLDETVSIMRTLDTLRAQWGLKYPME
jgi:predicted dehydrogenase